MDNLELFLSTYKKNLKKCAIENPEEYAWSIEEFHKIIERMNNAIVHGTFNKDSKAFKNTCKELKIKHTYKDIANFIKE